MPVPGLWTVVMLAVVFVEPQTRSELRFGVIEEEGRTSQARFEVMLQEDRFVQIVLAPYGIRPSRFERLIHDDNGVAFVWRRSALEYHCRLKAGHPAGFRGECLGVGSKPVSIVMREFGPEDAALQGNQLAPSATDVAIVNRARALLMDGRGWNRADDRVCTDSAYPYRWSLFCALHQASIDVEGEYRHLRPAIRAVRDAIERHAPGRMFAHLLQDYNNQAETFDQVRVVLEQAEAALRALLDTANQVGRLDIRPEQPRIGSPAGPPAVTRSRHVGANGNRRRDTDFDLGIDPIGWREPPAR